MNRGLMKRWMACAAIALTVPVSMQAQSKLYPHLFDLQEVSLTAGVFKTAMEINDRLLLQYDVDRLLTPFCRQAGFTDWERQHPNFQNWGSGNFRLDGHVGGHYMSALALAYAAATDETTRAAMKERLDYMVDKMAECQAVFDHNTDGLYGYVGGYPDNSVWTRMYAGDLGGFNGIRGSVPIYTMHKVYAGFRDAWLYAGNEKAKECFLKLCDWGINLISKYSDAQVQGILDTEHGGINEVYVDAYQMTGDVKYLTAARRYSHTTMVTNMQTMNTWFLDNKHANTQVPKYIGFIRVAQQDDVNPASSVATYRKAAQNFWTDVTSNRTVAIGGNSVNEHFLAAANGANYISQSDGPESCNTNNMLKLTENLFADQLEGFEDGASTKYSDFYEMAMYNHILSTQHPETGGYVYFTPLRPQHYRIYSQVNQGMWCCVGTGMENHSKYGEFIYAHKGDTLYVNLFIPSKLTDETYALTQQTDFPYGDQTELTVDKAGDYAMAIRRPSWCGEGFAITVNGEAVTALPAAGNYVFVKRAWHEGDKVTVSLPMQLNMLELPNYSQFVAFRYGPILLGAKTSTENLIGLHAGEGRMDHAPSNGAQMSLNSAPMLIGDRAAVLDSIYMVDREQLHFKIRAGLYNSDRFADLLLQPFYTVHDARYMMYWQQLTQSEWDGMKDEVEAEENAIQWLNERTVDFVATGEQQSDAGHALTGTFGKGTYSGEFYVDATRGNWFSYQLATKGRSEDLSLMCRYHAADAGRVSTIYVNGKVLANVTLDVTGKSGHFNVEYPIPAELMMDENGVLPDSITVKFVASGTTPVPGLYYLRLLKDYQNSLPKPYSFVSTQWGIGDAGRVDKVEYNEVENTIKVYGKSGANNIALQYDVYRSDSNYLTPARKYLTVCGSSLASGSGKSYLWWLCGTNVASQVAPTYEVARENGELIVVWDVTTSGLDANMKSDRFMFSANGKAINTVFGLTSTAVDGTSVISDINFYDVQGLLKNYPELQTKMGMNVFDEKETDYAPMDVAKALLIKDFSAEEWTPVCFPFAVSRTKQDDYFSELYAFLGVHKSSEETMTLYFEEAEKIDAGKLYLVKALKDSETLELAGVRPKAGIVPDVVEASGVSVKGTYAALLQPEDNTYILKGNEFVPLEDTEMVKGMSFFLVLSEEEAASLAAVSLSFDAMPDGIREQMGVQEESPVYTLDGFKIQKKMKELPRGIYIVGGKKVAK